MNDRERLYTRLYMEDYRAGKRRRAPKPPVQDGERYCTHCKTVYAVTRFSGNSPWCKFCKAEYMDSYRDRQKRERFASIVRRARGTGT